jgi:hypothetical protein
VCIRDVAEYAAASRAHTAATALRQNSRPLASEEDGLSPLTNGIDDEEEEDDNESHALLPKFQHEMHS